MGTTLADLSAEHIGKLVEVDDSVMADSQTVLCTATRRVRLLDFQQRNGATRLLDGLVPQWPTWIEWADWRTFRVLN
ncbi:hypothetical protein ADK61_22525 [Streptomyces sp. XY66]|uniref:hypothetical protein n=1 Tax=Streptomyces sp. XY66 TaxID=1415563 RepID=UPI0006AE54C5|nr:hypothetical protein [Streptomyces sp. XY66]KOU73754.1 hypothetical protein ADK61_22525 [Streptomyces sp. XY66]